MNKEKYKTLCNAETTIPIFSMYWWLDATCGKDNWDVAILEKNGKITASLPYSIIKSKGLLYISQPQLTQTLGPWVKPFNSKYAKALEQEKKILQTLFKMLPSFDVYQQSWSYRQKNWLPLHWMGYTQKSNITYRLEDLSNQEAIWDGFRANIRTDIRKANKKGITIKEEPSVEDFLALNKKVFLRQNKALPYDEALVKNIYAACLKKECTKIFLAVDHDGNHHAAVFIVWDKYSAYYIMGGGDPELRNSGATSFCMWEAIKYSATVTKSFDFEGSMIEPVERFFRAFGAKQTPYSSLYKSNSKKLDFLKAMKLLFQTC